MCSRYYIDNSMLDLMNIPVAHSSQSVMRVPPHDVCPGQCAPVIAQERHELSLREMKWGFPQLRGKGLFINARAETALQKRTFSESVLYRRCVISAVHFYEWDAEKNRVTFSKKDAGLLYMAGFFDLYQEESRFVILTTQANPSVAPVHERMPLILGSEDVEPWICRQELTESFLQKVPAALTRTQEYEQQNLFDYYR
ncbi:MAG: SOS response-associated peptidase [Lachnospiraceae bacterium]|nr:SOS response-associated peptidase [Lachnospiraceae bacterium]